MYLFDIADEPCPLFNKLGSDIIGDNPIDIIEMDDDKIDTNNAITVSEPIDADLLDVFSPFLGIDFLSIEGLFSFEDIKHNDRENIDSHSSYDKYFSISLNDNIAKNDAKGNGRMDATVYDDDKRYMDTNKEYVAETIDLVFELDNYQDNENNNSNK